jgi:hypothetical protein
MLPGFGSSAPDRAFYFSGDTLELLISDSKSFVDDNDYDLVSKYQWHINSRRGLKYAVATIDGEPVLMHRLITQAPNGVMVDHINGNGLDNRRVNLRLCTHSQNMRNRKMHSNNATGFKGVYKDGRCKTTKKYCAQIRFNGKRIYLGRYTTPEEAYQVYCDASVKYHGEFGRII